MKAANILTGSPPNLLVDFEPLKTSKEQNSISFSLSPFELMSS